MPENEKRTIYQCTHNTIYDNESRPEGAVFHNTLFKIGIMRSIISNDAISNIILEQMVQLNHEHERLSELIAHLNNNNLPLLAEGINQYSDESFHNTLMEYVDLENEYLSTIDLYSLDELEINNEETKKIFNVLSDSIINTRHTGSLINQSNITNSFLRTVQTFWQANTAQNDDDILNKFTSFLKADKFKSKTVIEETVHWKRVEIQEKLNIIRNYIKTSKQSPIGILHLEKLNFIPIGYDQGDLVYSLPLVPGETVRLTHREWSHTDKEFVEIINDSLEVVTEDELNEKSELTNSFKYQQQQSESLQLSANVSGNYGPVSFSTGLSYNVNEAESSSRESSAKRSQEITSKAAAKSKKDHKVTFKIGTESKQEDESFREIKNDTDTNVRWDYHRLIKKWKIELYRYDIRMTYDLIIPEPGSYLVRNYKKLKRIEQQINEPFEFVFSPESILPADKVKDERLPKSWLSLSKEHGVGLPPPPEKFIKLEFEKVLPFEDSGSETLDIDANDYLEISLPKGYHFDNFIPTNKNVKKGNVQVGTIDVKKNENMSLLNSGAKNSEKFHWLYYIGWAEHHESAPQRGDSCAIKVNVTAKRTKHSLREWQMDCYNILMDGARLRYEKRQQQLTEERDQLLESLERDDSLSLRKIEREELMKGLLRWIFGSDFEFYPDDLPKMTQNEDEDISLYNIEGRLSDSNTFKRVLQHSEIIRFLHQAIEWENVNYILYPYFWTHSQRWNLKQRIYHSDHVHRTFLRAGAARVVFTIRPEFEKAFLHFANTLEINMTPEDEEAPYLTIAEEVEKLAQTQYHYSLNANEENPDNLIKYWYEYTPTSSLDVNKGTVSSLEPEADPNNDN